LKKYKDLGNSNFKNEDYEGAYENYSKAIEIDPENALVLSNRSVTLSKLKRYEEALKDAQKVIELKPKWSKGYLRLGTSQYNVGKHEESLETLKKKRNGD